MARILETNNYNQFKHFPSNRPIKEYALVDSIQQKNLLHLNPIMVTKDFYIVDGQHRLEAAKILDIPIYYVVDPHLTEDDIAILNFNQKSWVIGNFLNFFVGKKISDYIFLDRIMREYKLPLHFVVYSALARGSDCYQYFKSGKISIKNKELLEESFYKYNEVYTLCSKICDLTKGIHTKGMRSLWTFIHKKKYVHQRFMEKCTKHCDLVITAFSFKDEENIQHHLEKIYNHCSKANSKVKILD